MTNIVHMTWVRNDLGTKWPGYKITGNEVCRWTCMSLFSRRAMLVLLDDQENIICTLPSHIATRTVVAICYGKVCTELLWWLYAKGTLCGSILQRHGTCYSLESKIDYDHWWVARNLIFQTAQTCCKPRAEIALYGTQSHEGRTMSY